MAPAALGLQALQVVVTYLGALERRALAEVLLDVVVLHPGLSGPTENLRPVDAAPADFGEGARPLVHVRRGRVSRLAVLDVPQGEPARILLEVIERVFAGARDPIAIELELDQFRVRSPQELVVGRYAVERLELKVVVVVGELDAGPQELIADFVEEDRQAPVIVPPLPLPRLTKGADHVTQSELFCEVEVLPQPRLQRRRLVVSAGTDQPV